MRIENLFGDHIKEISKRTVEALEKNGWGGLLIHSGSRQFFHADDQEISFRAIPHFTRFIPAETPNNLLFISRNGGKPFFVEVILEDFWEEPAAVDEKTTEFLRSEFDCTSVKTPKEVWKRVQERVKGKVAFIGDRLACKSAKILSLPKDACNPASLLSHLDEGRSRKTPYEICCIEEANKKAALGHKAARETFLAGASELEIHWAFLESTKTQECELPYPTIVALNEKGATLHYQHKRLDVRNGKTLLMDAGVKHLGYASDITRTYATPLCHPVFTSLIKSVEKLQLELIEKVRPGLQFIELHHAAHLGIADILHSQGIITKSGEEMVRLGITQAFFPHGLGHMLGIQVHDVGSNSDAGLNHPLRELYPKLRANRMLEADNVITIEPGTYFIEMLLKPHREGKTKELFNWKLIDELKLLGGIRIEDNILVTETGRRNLTRAYLQ